MTTEFNFKFKVSKLILSNMILFHLNINQEIKKGCQRKQKSVNNRD